MACLFCDRLGKSGLKVSKVILGAMSFGQQPPGVEGWELPEDQALPVIKHAYDLGINTWDTVSTNLTPYVGLC